MTTIDQTQTSLFDDLFADSDEQNRLREEAKRYAHLPETMEDGIPYCRALILKFDAAMLAADVAAAEQVCKLAHDLAYKLNRFESGILAHPDSAGCVLERETAATIGEAPLWGQSGVFDLPEFNARIEMEGLFGVGAPLPGFAAHAIDEGRLFVSETGYRSFVGLRSVVKDLSPDQYASDVLRRHIAQTLKGKLRTIE